MIDHTLLKIPAALFDETIAFYSSALQPLGYTKLKEFPGKAAGFGEEAPDLWLFASPATVEENEKGNKAHFALRAKDRSTIRHFHEAALKAGGKDNGAPGLRERIHEHCYAAFILDPAGNNIEAICHNPESS